MKKIVSPTGEIRLDGWAESDGVVFKAIKSSTNPFRIALQHTFARSDDSGDIITESSMFMLPSIPRIDAKLSKIAKTTFIILTILSAVLFIASIAFIATSLPEGLMFHFLYSMFFVTTALLSQSMGVGVAFAKLLGNQDIISFSKFFSARNAVTSAYYGLGRVPTLEEAKEYSYYSPANEYTKFNYIATFFIAISFIRLIPNLIVYVLVAILVSVIIFTLDKKNKLLFWQNLIVEKPDDIHYETAISALNEAINFANNEKKHIFPIPFPVELLPNFPEEKCNGCECYDFCKLIHNSLVEGNSEKNNNIPKEVSEQ